MKRFITLFALLLGTSVLAQSTLAQRELRRAERSLRNQELNVAMEQVMTFLQDNPDNANAYELRARIHQAMAAAMGPDEYLDHITDMKKDFTQAEALDPGLADGIMVKLRQFWIDTFNLGIERFNAAIGSVDLGDEHAQRIYRESALYFEATAISSPDSADSYVNWAYALLRSDDGESAVVPLNKALEYGDPDLEIYDFLGRIYLNIDSAEAAVPILEEGMMHFPENQALQDYLLNAYATTGQFDRAMNMYSTTIQQAPLNKVYRYNYGSLLLQAEQFDEAIEQLGHAVQLDPAYKDANYNLGASYINKANNVQAEINALEDFFSANRDTLSTEDKDAHNAKVDALSADRVALYEQSIPYLESARQAAYPGQVLLSYFNSYPLVEFVEDNYGIDAVIGILQAFGRGASQEESMQEALAALDVTLDELDRAFGDHLETLPGDLEPVMRGWPDMATEEVNGVSLRDFLASLGEESFYDRLIGKVEDEGNLQQICGALYQAYVQTNRLDELELVTDCAEM